MPNPPPGRTHPKIYLVWVENFGTVADGPAAVSLAVLPVNPTCPAPEEVRAITPTNVTMDPGDRRMVIFMVMYRRCINPALRVDYLITGVVAAPGDGNPANDSATIPEDVRGPGWWPPWHH
ncbi:MAG: hypothetical protein Q8O76_00505 [Chloroflexota bacterium]|nr:hypothetical protein [Chloroflexota bacterium]